MPRIYHIVDIASLLVVAGCSKEPPPRSVTELMENPMLLEAALVRCTQNRAETRYEAECVNAREAVKIIEAREAAERRAELDIALHARLVGNLDRDHLHVLHGRRIRIVAGDRDDHHLVLPRLTELDRILPLLVRDRLIHLGSRR